MAFLYISEAKLSKKTKKQLAIKKTRSSPLTKKKLRIIEIRETIQISLNHIFPASSSSVVFDAMNLPAGHPESITIISKIN